MTTRTKVQGWRAVFFVALSACGARTGLDVTGEDIAIGGTLPGGEGDGGGGAASVAGHAGGDAGHAGRGANGGHTSHGGGGQGGVVKSDCVAQGVRYIYVVTESNELFAFDPQTLAFRSIGVLSCPSVAGASPFSMAVSRRGIAYVAYNSGELFRVSTATASCKSTAYEPGQNGFLNFGMGYATDEGGPSETLYVANSALGMNTTAVPALGKIDTGSFALTQVGKLPSAATGMELTGTGDGRLYGFFGTGDTSSILAEIDKKTGAFVDETILHGITPGRGWAFGFWGGDFWFFTAASSTGSTVTRYHPDDGSLAPVAALGSVVVGAGVSTCAPEE